MLENFWHSGFWLALVGARLYLYDSPSLYILLIFTPQLI